MEKLRVGDTIQCHDDEEMIRVSNELMKEGIYTDWFDIKDPVRRNILTITKIESEGKK